MNSALLGTGYFCIFELYFGVELFTSSLIFSDLAFKNCQAEQKQCLTEGCSPPRVAFYCPGEIPPWALLDSSLTVRSSHLAGGNRHHLQPCVSAGHCYLHLFGSLFLQGLTIPSNACTYKHLAVLTETERDPLQISSSLFPPLFLVLCLMNPNHPALPGFSALSLQLCSSSWFLQPGIVSWESFVSPCCVPSLQALLFSTSVLCLGRGTLHCVSVSLARKSQY